MFHSFKKFFNSQYSLLLLEMFSSHTEGSGAANLAMNVSILFPSKINYNEASFWKCHVFPSSLLMPFDNWISVFGFTFVSQALSCCGRWIFIRCAKRNKLKVCVSHKYPPGESWVRFPQGMCLYLAFYFSLYFKLQYQRYPHIKAFWVFFWKKFPCCGRNFDVKNLLWCLHAYRCAIFFVSRVRSRQGRMLRWMGYSAYIKLMIPKKPINLWCDLDLLWSL